MSRPTIGATTLAVLATLATAGAPRVVGAAPLIGLVNGNGLVRFDSATPAVLGSVTPLTGLGAGEVLVGIDVRPSTGRLYGIARAGTVTRLLAIDPDSGATTAVGSVFAAGGTDFGVDFNPVLDRLRVVSDTGTNLSINPESGVVTVQTTLNPGSPDVVGAAYINNTPGATTTTLFGIEAASDALVIQNPPANGTLVTVGPLGVATSGQVGFDVAPGGTAFAALQVAGVSALYTINLTTGAATLVGTIGSGATAIGGLAVAPKAGRIATAPDAGSSEAVRVFGTPGAVELFRLAPYGSGFKGGVRVAVGDVNGDGTPDVVTAPGKGSPEVRVFDGRTGQPLTGNLSAFLAYDPGFTGGVYVAVGDVNGDGLADIVTGAGAGRAGPHVRVFSGVDGSELGSFFAYDPAFRGGVRVAAGDVDGDGSAEIVTGAGKGKIGPHVKVFKGATGSATLAEFFPFDPKAKNGVHVAAGDLDGDGRADVVTGPDRDGDPHVRAFTGSGAPFASFFAYPVTFRGGIRVATGDVNGDGRAEILTAPGKGREGPHVRAFDGVTNGAVPLVDFFAYDPTFLGGVFVGGN